MGKRKHRKSEKKSEKGMINMTDNMSKDFYLLFNDMEQNVEEYEEIPVTNEDIRRWKKSFIKNRNNIRSAYPVKRMVAAACAIFAIMLAVGPFKDYTSAAIEHVSYTLSEALGFDYDISSYETIVGKSITKDGYTITLESVILDGSKLYLTYTERFPEKLVGVNKIEAANEVTTNLSGTINGTNHEISGGGTYRPVDDYTRLAIMDMDFEKSVDVSKPVRIKLSYEVWKDNNGKSKKVIDDIDMVFVADGSQLALETEEMPLDYTYEFPDGSSVHFTRLETNPVSRKLFFIEKNAHDSGYMWELRMHDDFGNYIWNISRGSSANNKGELEGCISYTAGDADMIDEDATQIICEMWGGYLNANPGESVEGEYMEQIGESFVIPIK